MCLCMCAFVCVCTYVCMCVWVVGFGFSLKKKRKRKEEPLHQSCVSRLNVELEHLFFFLDGNRSLYALCVTLVYLEH